MIGNTNAVRISNVNKTFKVKSQDVRVLKNISINIPYREFAIIFGPSGSGKSTLLNTILGLEEPDTGDVEVMGLNIYDLREEELCDYRKKFVGMVYQQANWIKAFNVIENVAFPLILQGEDKRIAFERSREFLERVGMLPWAYYLPSELSSGQQQKVSLARALVTKPELIIGDEPTGSMDLASSEELLQLLKNFSNEGKTIILVTHNSDNIKYSDIVIRVLDGEIVKSYSPEPTNLQDAEKLETEKQNLYAQVENPMGSSFSTNFANKPPLDLYKKVRVPIKKKFNLIQSFKDGFTYVKKSLISSLIVFIYIFEALIARLTNLRFFKNSTFGTKFNDRVYSFFRKVSIGLQRKDRFTQIAYIDLVELAFKNMFLKKMRTLITVGGIALGIAFIVFLISIGYGIERLIMSRVATLEQLKQIDITPTISTNVVINDEVLSKFKAIQDVQSVYPVINIAGKIIYNNSNLDVVVYGAQKDYMTQSALIPNQGKLFDSNSSTSDTQPQTVSAPVSSPTDGPSDLNERLVNLPDKSKDLLVNETFLRSLNISPENALNKSLTLKFIVTGQLLENEDKVETNYVPYKIIGVLPQGETPVVYVPLSDVKDIGLNRYSSTSIVLRSSDRVAITRGQIELMGFRTTSVMDTIVQIEALFTTVRTLLALVGLTALVVSTLGMFNTLTVSLLERTREVGLMKAMGMRSDEVQDLFVIESISMSILGGLVGIFIGVGTGKVLSLVLTLISQTRGFDGVDIAYVPVEFLLAIVLLSVFVGMTTGYIPSRRANKISALNALRYE